jgi:hypothetical protein
MPDLDQHAISVFDLLLGGAGIEFKHSESSAARAEKAIIVNLIAAEAVIHYAGLPYPRRWPGFGLPICGLKSYPYYIGR